MDSQTCATCAHERVNTLREPCCRCSSESQWVPKPELEPEMEPEAGGVTVEAVDAWIAWAEQDTMSMSIEQLDMLRSLRPLVARSEHARRVVDEAQGNKGRGCDLLVRSLAVLSQRAGGEAKLAELVEEAAAKRRIVAAGCRYVYGAGSPQNPIRVWYRDETNVFPNWLAAAEWAEAPEKRDRWSEPVHSMTVGRVREVLGMLGVHDVNAGYQWLAGNLIATARERGLLDRDGSRVKLGGAA